MKAFAKTLFGDARNLAGVAVLLLIACGLTGIGRADWAVYVMPVAGLAVAGWLARH